MNSNVFSETFCEGCDYFITAKETALKNCESVFDAVIDVRYFCKNCYNQGCKKNIEKYKTSYDMKNKGDH